MTRKQAQQAIENKSIIQFIDNPDNWGIPTCMDDDETGVYYSKNGCGFTKLFVGLSQIELG